MVISCPASFPCGRKHSELLFRGRSLWNQSEQLDTIILPSLNFTEDKLMNATESEHGGNKTEDLIIPRVVGGVLEKQGGSPWQVCPQIPHYTTTLIFQNFTLYIQLLVL